MLPTMGHPAATHNQLYRLTLQLKDRKTDVYSMSTSVELAFQHYLERLNRRQESTLDIALVSGELARP